MPSTQILNSQIPSTQIPNSQIPGTQMPKIQMPRTKMPKTQMPQYLDAQHLGIGPKLDATTPLEELVSFPKPGLENPRLTKKTKQTLYEAKVLASIKGDKKETLVLTI